MLVAVKDLRSFKYSQHNDAYMVNNSYDGIGDS